MNTCKSVSSGSVKKLREIFFYQVVMEMTKCPEEAILGRIDLDRSLVLPLQRQWFSNVMCTESPGAFV